MSKITVHYQELRSFGNFQNAQVGLSVDIEGEVIPSETAEAVLAQSKAWVRTQLDLVEHEERGLLGIEARSVEAAWILEQREREVAAAQAKVELAAERVQLIERFLQRHDLPIPWSEDEKGDAFDVPF